MLNNFFTFYELLECINYKKNFTHYQSLQKIAFSNPQKGQKVIKNFTIYHIQIKVSLAFIIYPNARQKHHFL